MKRKSLPKPSSRQTRKSSDSDIGVENVESDLDDELRVFDEQPPIPIISNQAYYWIGKDYTNTYNADFKDIDDFSSGR